MLSGLEIRLRKWDRRAALIAVLIMTVTLFSQYGLVNNYALPLCAASADEFCYRFRVDIANATGADFDDYPVALDGVNLNRLITAGRLGEHAADFMPVNIGLIEQWGFAQEINTNADKTVFIMADVPDGTTAISWVLLGNAEHKRDQGIYIYNVDAGADTVTITDHADFDLTDDFAVVARIQATATAADTGPDQDGEIISKYNLGANTGYELVSTSTTTGKLALTIGSGAASDTLEVDWDGSEQWVRARVDVDSGGGGEDIFIDFLDSTLTWIEQGSKDTTLASVAVNADNIIMGTSWTGEISEAYILTGISGTGNSGTKVAQWGFEPDALIETQEGTVGNGWTYTGTVPDHFATHDATYSLVNAQTSITVTLSPILFNFGSTAIEFTLASPDLVGDLGTGDFSSDPDSPAYRDFGLFGDALGTAIDSTPIGSAAFRLFLLLLVIAVLGWALMKGVGNEPYVDTLLMVMGIGVLGIGVLIELIPVWYGVVPMIAAFVMWLLVRRIQQ